MKNYIQEIFPNVWGNLYWYQKLYIILSFAFKKSNKTFHRECVVCGKDFESKPSYDLRCARGSGKTKMETARYVRNMCCSEKCFKECWDELWNGVENNG